MFSRLNFRQSRHGDADRQNEQRYREEIDVQSYDGRRFFRCALGNCRGRRPENHPRAHPRKHCRAQRIEGLRKVQSARRRLRFSQHSHIGICRDLKNRDSGCEHDQRRQEKRKRGNSRRRIECETSRNHRQQSRDDRSFVSQPVNNLGRRNRKDKISREESRLNQHAGGKLQVEDMLSIGNEHVVQRGERTPHEEQRGNDREWASISAGCLGYLTLRWCTDWRHWPPISSMRQEQLAPKLSTYHCDFQNNTCLGAGKSAEQAL